MLALLFLESGAFGIDLQWSTEYDKIEPIPQSSPLPLIHVLSCSNPHTCLLEPRELISGAGCDRAIVQAHAKIAQKGDLRCEPAFVVNVATNLEFRVR